MPFNLKRNIILFVVFFMKAKSFSFMRVNRYFKLHSTYASDVIGEKENILSLKAALLKYSALSSRGQLGQSRVPEFLSLLEGNQLNLDEKFLNLIGEWDLIYAEDDITRSSPFFWAFRKALIVKTDILSTSKMAESIFSFTDAIPLKSIGECRQTITVDSNERKSHDDLSSGCLVSQVKVDVFLAGSSLMTTTSSWKLTEEPGVIEIQVDKTEVLKSTIAKLLPFASSLAFPSGAALELIRPGSSTVYMRLTYLDEDLRVVRNIDDNRAYVFTKVKEI